MLNFRELLLEGPLKASDYAHLGSTKNYLNPNAVVGNDAMLSNQLWPAEAFKVFANWNGKAIVVAQDWTNVEAKDAEIVDGKIKKAFPKYNLDYSEEENTGNFTNVQIRNIFEGIPILYINSIWMCKIGQGLAAPMKSDKEAQAINKKVLADTFKKAKAKHVFMLGKSAQANLNTLFGGGLNKLKFPDNKEHMGRTWHALPHPGNLGINSFMNKKFASDMHTKKPLDRMSKTEILKTYVQKQFTA